MYEYSVKIVESSKELTGKEKVKMKDVSDAKKFDDLIVDGDSLLLEVDYYVVLNIHNEKSDSVEYLNYLIIDTNGQKYVTGSESFWSSFLNIYEEMKEVNEEWMLKIYKLPSKNYKGKEFLSCSIE